MKWEQIDDILTSAGAKKLKVGQVLLFDNEGISIHLKIMRKYKGKVWAKHTHLYTEDEMRRRLRKV